MDLSFYNHFLGRTLSTRKRLGKQVSGVILYLGVIYFFVFVFDLGYRQTAGEEVYLKGFYEIVQIILTISFIVRNVLNVFNRSKILKVKLLDLLILLVLIFITSLYSPEGIHFYGMIEKIPSYKYLVSPILGFIFAIEYSRNAVSYYSPRLNPYLILVFSFVAIILIGAFLLSLPNSTNRHISLIDTLFMSTSAVCVTGLSVIDVSADLTILGQIILLVLIQIGGLGIMTFASYVGFIFSGKNVSFQQRLVLRDLANSQRMNDVIHAVYKIVTLMFIIEILGALMIYYLLPDGLFDSRGDQMFFSIFHSVSAFCNAGLSNYPDGLHHVEMRFQPLLLLNISFLIILGGIGFPIMLNFYDYLKLWGKNAWNLVVHKRRFRHIPYLINLNSRLALYMTGILLSVGTFSYFVFEYNNTLREFDLWEKIAVSIFTSSTSRTAGFNVTDLSMINFSTYIIIVLLMWVGASPGGTGGGVKTTTFSIMVMNFWSMAKGERRLIIQGRKITSASINKSFAIVLASLMWIGVAVFLMMIFDSKFSLEQIVFEAFSAFSTTGLSLGITHNLSGSSKMILIFLMLIGRVGSIAFLSAFLYKKRFERVKYPEKEVKY